MKALASLLTLAGLALLTGVLLGLVALGYDLVR